MLSRNFILGFAVLCFKASYSLPSVEFPVDAQLPPVAVVEQQFSFTFSPATFTSTLDISYSARDLPSWLQFEASDRTLVGTPNQNDIGNSSLGLEATDSEGNIVVHLDLVVLAKSSIHADQDLFSKQLSRCGTCAAPNTILLSPETSFDLEFGSNVFESDGSSVDYYATSENHAPLPAWIRFDEGAVKFSGTTPSLLTPQSSPQTFNFSLLASQVPGFSQSSISFQISVTNHILDFVNPTQDFNISAGNTISIPPLIEQLRLDTRPISRDEIAKVSSNQPDWLMLRSSDLSFYGKAPEGINNTAFRLEVDDEFDNIANIDIQLRVSTFDNMKAQEVYLGTKNITVGQQFNYTFTDIDSGAVDVEVDLGLADSWLHFERTNVSIYGTVPTSIGDDILNISVIVRQDGQVLKLEHLTLQVSNVHSSATIGSSGKETAVSRPTSTRAASPVAEPHDNSRRHLLAIVITISVILFLLSLVLIGFFIRRSRKKRAQNVPYGPPVREHLRSPSSGNIVVFTEDDFFTETEGESQPPSLAPQVSIHWAQDRLPTRRPALGVDTRTIGTSHNRSSWNDMLMEVGNPHGQILGNERRRYDDVSDGIVDARTEESSSPTIPPSLSNSRETMAHTPLQAGSVHTPKFDGRRIGGLGHGNSMATPNINIQRATLRPVPLSPLSPLSESSPVKSSILESNPASRSFASRNWVLPKPLEASSGFGGREITQRRSSFSSGGSGYENLEEDQPSGAYKHIRRRTASTPFSGSLWEDEEWMTEDSASKSGHWKTQELPYSESQVPTESSTEDSVVRQWHEEPPRSIIAAMSHATSMSSQTNSLRFI